MKNLVARSAQGLAAIGLLLCAPVLADDTAIAVQAAPVAAAGTGPALWKVADEDTTIYLFGTVHVLPENINWMDARITNALNASDTIVTELAMDAADQIKLQKVSREKGMLPEGTTLRSLLTPEQTRIYEGAFRKMGFPPAALDQFDTLKPWLAGMTISSLTLMRQGYSPETGVEKVLMQKSMGKRRGALETPEYQLGVFDNLPLEAQVNFLMETAEGIDKIKSTVDRMVAKWVTGDADALAEIMNEGVSDPVLADALLHSRNANWAKWIEERLAEPGTIFVAVGAGHLAGDKSVQTMLADKGIVATRVQ
ncbi:MAG: TraB/GumN family protein [Erythrobacter sp.]